jgi:PAS domain S-box-containing protein
MNNAGTDTQNNILSEHLQESEYRFHELVECLPVVFFECDSQGRIIFVSDAGCRILGYTREELFGQPFYRFVTPEERNRATTTAQNVMAGKLLGDNEFSIIKKDGSSISAFIKSVLIHNNRGDASGLRGILIPINRDKSIEAAIRASEEKYRTLANNLKLGITRSTTGEKGRFLEVNKAMEEITGYSRDEILSMTISDLFINARDRTDFLVEIIEKKGTIQQESILTKKDGTEILISGTSTPVMDPQGNILYIDGIIEDITARKKAEDLLRQSEAKFRISAENSPNMIFIKTRTRVEYVNQKCEQVLGYTKEEFYAQDFDFLTLIAPENREMISLNFNLRQLDRALSANEYTLLTKNGNRIDVILNMGTIDLQNEKGYIGIVTDITEWKKAEKVLKTSEEELRSLYQTEKIQRLELEREAKARGMFVDVLAHELRTPLTPLMASIGMLQDLNQGEKDDIQTKLIKNMAASIQNLANRLEELLDLARFARGTFKLKVQPTNLNKFLPDVITRFKPTIEGRKQQLVMELPTTLPWATIDASRLEQVIVNLLSNASKFSPRNGLIICRIATNDYGLQMDVIDKGSGITPEAQARLFEPYHRVEQDRQQLPGLGLGLAVAKQIVEAHGGKIWLVSQPGQGSTFSFQIPVMAAPRVEANR